MNKRDFNKFSKGYFMKSFKVRIAYFVCIFVLKLLMGTSLVYGASDAQVGDHTTPEALVAVALSSGSGVAGMTSQVNYPVVNGDNGTAAASALGTGFHDAGAVAAETNSNPGIVKGMIPRAHTECQDSCSL